MYCGQNKYMLLTAQQFTDCSHKGLNEIIQWDYYLVY